MAIACVAIPHFALRIAVLDHPELDGQPLVLGAPPGRRPLVTDCTPEAARQGVRAGMLLREATALCPEAVVCPPNPIREAMVAEQIVIRLEALSPLVESDPVEPGSTYLDLHGLDRHYPVPAAAAGRLLQAVPPVLRPRVGVAPGKFAARVAAGRAMPGAARVVDPTEVTRFLAGNPVACLPLPPETLRRFERLGLRTLGELAALPAAAVHARFGPIGRRAWELASGRDDARVQPRPREETVIEKLTLPTPSTSRETFLLALEQLVVRAFGRPVLRHRHVRQVRLRTSLEEGRSWEQTMTLRAPAGGQQLTEILRLRLQALELPGAVEALTLELTGLTAETAQQDALPRLTLRPRRPRQLVDATRQLKQRYGFSPLAHVVEVEPWSRIPERRHALISYDP